MIREKIWKISAVVFMAFVFLSDVNGTMVVYAETTQQEQVPDILSEEIPLINTTDTETLAVPDASVQATEQQTDKDDAAKTVAEDLKTEQEEIFASEKVNMPLTLNQKGNTIEISYSNVADSNTYILMVKENDGSYKELSNSQSNHMNVRVVNGILYRIKVISKNEGGDVIGESSEYKISLPNAVSSIKTSGQSKKKVLLTWTGADNASYYTVYRKVNGGSYSKLGNTKSNAYTDDKIVYGKAYTYKIVSYFTDGAYTFEGASATVSYSNKKIVSTNHKKYTYAEMVSDIEALTAKYDGMVTYEVIGKSCDKRKIYDVILGNPNAKKTLLVVGTMHAREYMCSLLLMNQIEYYLESYNSSISREKVSSTLNSICIHYVPMANPDGVTISQSGISKIRDASLRKKLKKITKGKGTSKWKANARGVDLNRNWAYKWKKQGKKASASGYSGPKANSEPETKALLTLKKDLKNKTKLKATISYHTMGNIVFGKCTKKSIKSTTTKMYKLAKGITGYACGDTTYGGKGIGNSREWDMYKLGVPSITIEVGKKAAPGPISEFKKIWSKNKNVVIREAMLLK